MVRVAASLAYNLSDVYLVIVPNNGAITNLQNDAMVEVPAALTSDGPKAFTVGKIPTFQKAMIESQLGYEKLVVDAWYEGSQFTRSQREMSLGQEWKSTSEYNAA